MNKKIMLTAYSDAASFNNGRKLSDYPEHSCSAGLLVYNNTVLMTAINYNPNSSISYGELFGIYMMLTEIDNLLHDEEFELTLYSDSAYSVQSINEWSYNWRRNAINGIWQSSTGPVAYQSILMEIFKILYKRKGDIKIKHISGHIDMSKKKHIDKALKRYLRFNKEVIEIEELYFHTVFNNLCDGMAKEALKESMRGVTRHGGLRPRFKKYISS